MSVLTTLYINPWKICTKSTQTGDWNCVARIFMHDISIEYRTENEQAKDEAKKNTKLHWFGVTESAPRDWNRSIWIKSIICKLKMHSDQSSIVWKCHYIHIIFAFTSNWHLFESMYIQCEIWNYFTVQPFLYLSISIYTYTYEYEMYLIICANIIYERLLVVFDSICCLCIYVFYLLLLLLLAATFTVDFFAK